MFRLVNRAFGGVMYQGGARFAYLARVYGALLVVARRGVNRSAIVVHVYGVVVRLSNFIVVSRYEAVVFRRYQRVNAVMMDVGRVKYRDGRAIWIYCCHVVVCHTSLLVEQVSALFNAYDFFNFLVLRLFAARRDSRGMDERRYVVRRSNLYRIIGQAYGVLCGVGVRHANGAFHDALLVFRGNEDVDVSRYGVRLGLLFDR